MDFNTVKNVCENTRRGTIARVKYVSELPVKKEFKDSIRIIKVTEKSVQLGVDAKNIKDLKNVSGKTRNTGYRWIVENFLSYNDNTNKNYLRIKRLNNHDNKKISYMIITNSGVSMSDSYDKNYIRNSYFSSKSPIVQNIELNHVISINGIC